MKLIKIQKPFTFLLFGASGDLASLKIFPALYAMALQHRFPKNFQILGFARTPKTRSEFQREFEQSVRESEGKNLDKKVLVELVKHVYYFSGDYSKVEDFHSMRSFMDKTFGKSVFPLVCYFAIPPTVFQPIIKNLEETRERKDEDIRLVLEKPFGVNEQSAKDLFQFTSNYFSEKNLYLLDHYLGKESVRSIFFLRKFNRVLHILLNPENIANIQINAMESVGVKTRAHYFDQVGIIKDMIQSHLLQILSLITMSIPASGEYSGIHREKAGILSSLVLSDKDDNISLGQYEGYCHEEGVPKNSKTETFAALRLFIDKEGWADVPIYLRTGKMLPCKRTYIVIELKKFGFQKDEEPNRVIIQTHPNEEFAITMLNRNGVSIDPSSLSVSDTLACTGDDCLPEHGLLLLDIMRGDKTYFLTCGEVIASWKLIDKAMAQIKSKKVVLKKYKPGSQGPKTQEGLVKRDGFKWYNLK